MNGFNKLYKLILQSIIVEGKEYELVSETFNGKVDIRT